MKMKFWCAAAALFAGTVVATAADPNEPVFHLSFDTEKEGVEVCVDRANPERVCKLHNTKRCSFAPGKVGNALYLDNAREKTAPKDNPNAYVEVPRFWDPDFAKAMSIEVWVKMAKDINYKRCLMYIVQCGWSYGPGFSLYYNWQLFQYLSGSTGDSKDRVTVQTRVADLRDQWVHVAATYDGEKKVARIYVNGECVGEKEDFVVTPPKNLRSPLFIGCAVGNARGWCGALDELKIYKRVLTPAEILEHSKFEL